MSKPDGWSKVADIVAAATPPRLGVGEFADHHPDPICLCGKSFYMHKIDTVKMARAQGDCEGFVLDILRWRIIRWADVKST